MTDIIPPAVPRPPLWPQIITAVASVVLVAVAVVGWLTLRQDITDLQEAVSEPVTVANPVETVTIANPVDEVAIKNIVETAAPSDALLYGSCFVAAADDSYEINVVAFSGGIEQEVAIGVYGGGSASSIALDIIDYYGGPLDFGEWSEECHDLDGWGE